MTAQTQQTVPTHGQTIVFTNIPVGSYCVTGEVYRVDRPKNKGDFRFVSVERGASTYDRPWTVARSAWQVA